MKQTERQPVAVTEHDFSEQVLSAAQPVLVDFWAEWCAPCRALGPVIENLASEFEGRARVAKVDVDANQQLAAQYGIRSIPTVMLFDKGELVETLVGVRPQTEYTARLEALT